MISTLFSQIAWLPVLAATIIYFVLGAIWYAVFAKPWIKAVGKTHQELQGGSKMTYLYALIAQFITCIALNWIIYLSGAQGLRQAIEIGIIVGLCFSVTGSAINNMFAFRPRNLILIDTGYNLAAIIISSCIMTLWR